MWVTAHQWLRRMHATSGLGFRITGLPPSLSSFPLDTIQAWLQPRFSHVEIRRAWWEQHVGGTRTLSDQVEPSLTIWFKAVHSWVSLLQQPSLTLTNTEMMISVTMNFSSGTSCCSLIGNLLSHRKFKEAKGLLPKAFKLFRSEFLITFLYMPQSLRQNPEANLYAREKTYCAPTTIGAVTKFLHRTVRQAEKI